MNHYKVFIKDINHIDLPSKAMLQLVNGSLLRYDLLSVATSSLRVLEVADNININDIVIVYDEFGTQVYLGIINTITGNELSCLPINSLFKDIVPTNNLNTSLSCEQMFSNCISTYYLDATKGYYDSKLANIFKLVRINYTSNTKNSFIFDNNSSISLEQLLIDMFKTNRIVASFKLDQLSDHIEFYLKVCSLSNIKIGDNSSYTTDFLIETQSQDNTKLVVFGEDGTYRKSYYSTTNGIVENDNDMFRPTFNKSVIIYSDDDLEKLKNDNLSEQLYMHQIKVSIIINK